MLILPSHEGGRLSRPRHYSKGAQPIPKAVYRSGCRDKHNRPRCDSNLGPLTPQSDALTARPLRPEQAPNKRGLLTEYLIETFDAYYFFLFSPSLCIFADTTCSDDQRSTCLNAGKTIYTFNLSRNNHIRQLFNVIIILLRPILTRKLTENDDKTVRFVQ